VCGRFGLANGKQAFEKFGELGQMEIFGEVYDLLPRYNASPMSKMPVVAVRNKKLVAQGMRWWLIPPWSKDGKPVYSAFNAKAETIDKSGLFARFFKSSRCLIPADAFYEWMKVRVETEVKGKNKEVIEKIPYAIRMKDEEPFMFAGLFSVWKDKEEKEFPSFTIITTTPNKLMSKIHNRMPVILPEKHFAEWLDRDFKDTAVLKKLLVPYPTTKMEAYRVSKMVSNARNDVPECLDPID